MRATIGWRRRDTMTVAQQLARLEQHLADVLVTQHRDGDGGVSVEDENVHR